MAWEGFRLGLLCQYRDWAAAVQFTFPERSHTDCSGVFRPFC